MLASGSSSRSLRFGAFEADLQAAELRKHGARIGLQDQPFHILAMLLERPGELITREELRQKLWPANTFVDFDRSLNKAMNKLRSALGDSADYPRYVETLHRRGYRFVAPIIGRNADAAAPCCGPHETPGDAFSISPKPTERPPSANKTRSAWSALHPQWRFVRVLAGTALILICLGAAYYRLPASLPVAFGSSAPAGSRCTIAVLGFKNLAGHAEEAWLSVALAEWLTTELSAKKQLRIVPEERVARMKKELSLAELDSLDRDTLARIHRALDADLVVVGSFASLGAEPGTQIRLDLRLQDARSGETMEAISETGSESQLFELVSRAGEDLRAALGIQAAAENHPGG